MTFLIHDLFVNQHEMSFQEYIYIDILLYSIFLIKNSSASLQQ